MSPRRPVSIGGGALRALAPLGLALTLTTCRDSVGPGGKGGAGLAQIAVAPVLASETQLAAFGLAIDRVRFVVVRPAADTLADTTVALPPDSAALDLDLRVPLVTSPETLSVSIIALSGTTPLFSGTGLVEVRSGGEPPPPTEIPVTTYVGPGAGVDSIVVKPRAPFIYFNDSLRFQVEAFQGGAPVTQFYVAWSTSDTTIARINGFGVLRAPASRTAVRVRARTPSGVVDSVPVTFEPLPTQLALIAGGAQSGTVGQQLATQLEVEVRAADNLSVGGVGVRFRSLSGGTPADTMVPSDAGGRAKVTGTLGPAAGPQSFQATVPAFPAITAQTFTATALAGPISAATSVVTASAGTVASGDSVTLTLRAKDAGGNNLSIGGDTVVFTRSGGTSTGAIAPATDNGNGTYTARFTGILAGTPTTIGATINGVAVTTTLPTVAVTPGAISAGTSLVSVSSITVVSGASVTLGLRAKDAAGNNLTTGGAVVVFNYSGGVSTGVVGATVDSANGKYTATFTGALAGAATTIGATVNGAPVASALPTVTVTPGAVSAAASVVTVSSDTIASGAIATLKLRAKDTAGNDVTAGGATVAFSFSGGVSTGTIGAAADSGTGVYTATFTGVVAGSATTIGATINGGTVTTPLPTVTVRPGAISAATSAVTASSGTVASGALATLTLQGRDAAGNNLATGGDSVVFTASGGVGVSTGTISATTDDGNGTYTATFTGALTGTATTIGATVNGVAATSTTAISVVPGNTAAAQSIITVSNDTVVAGAAITLTLQARDSLGNAITSGGSTVVFRHSGGVSTGTIAPSPATDNGNGTYTATFTGVTAGTATTIGATLDGDTVTSTLPTVVVLPGPTAIVDVVPAADTLRALNDSRIFAATARDGAGNALPGETFTWSSADTLIARVGAATGAATAVGNGTVTIRATAASNGTVGTAALVVAQVVTAVQVTPAVDTVAAAGLTAQFTAQARDANTNPVAGKTFVWASTNPLIATVNAAGLATAVLAGVDTITATVDGVTGLAVLTVLSAVHAADITADETWTAAASPHIVSGYLRILNGATLTIEDGATVKFDSAAGLQVGDAALGEAGGLVMSGTPGSIHLTANAATPVPGFWRGVEVQKTTAPLTWRNVDIEYAGGARANPIEEACILLVDPAASVDLDSLHIRHCIHAGIHHFAGNVWVHRSEIDSVTGAGIQAFAGVLRLDSTAIRGSGQLGLIFGNGSVDLAGAVANKFVGNAAGSVQMFARQLPGFGRQDSIAGNGFGPGGVGDTIVVDSGTVGAGVPAFTIYRQPAPYLVTGFVNVWSPSGVNVTLDTGLVMTFDTSAALSIGDFADSTGNTSGVSANLVSLGTAADPVVLRNRLGRPGWQGLFLGAQSGTPVVRHIRFVGGGYQPQGPFCQNCLVKTTGFFETLNTNLYVDAPIGTAPFMIDSIVSDSSRFYGLVVKRSPPEGVQVRDNAILNSAATGLVMRGTYNPKDSVSGNVLTGNEYALDIVADVLPGLGVNALGGNRRDTLLLHGGTLAASDTLPDLGYRWRVTQPMVVDSGAVLWVLAGDTVVFDDAASLTIGGTTPSAIRALGTSVAPILFTVTPGSVQGRWGGLEFANLAGFANLSSSTVNNLIIENAGGTVPCGLIDCLPNLVGAVRYSNASTNALTVDSITVRRSGTVALDVKDVAQSPLTIRNSQFYENPFSPMIKSPSPTLLSIHGSDLYHYNGQVIQTANAGTDSIDAQNDNWWGDAAGLTNGFEFQDSLGRGSLWFNAVRFAPFASGPHFPVGVAAQIAPATDTVLAGAAINSVIGDPDSLRARVLDQDGRGVAGYDVQWGTSTGSIAFLTSIADIGGRVGGVWTTDKFAGPQFVQASAPGLVGSPVTWNVILAPGPTASVNFQLLDTLTQGVVDAAHRSASFSSSNRSAALVSNARDAFGNITSPQTGFFFTDVPFNTGSQPYGVVDSVKADTVFFHPTAATPASYQLHGNFIADTLIGTLQDSILITVTPVAAGIRIAQDSALFTSICPVDPANTFCEQRFWAEVVDSGGAALPPSDVYHFNWTPDTAGVVTLRRSTGLANDTVYLTARSNGASWVTVDETLNPSLVPSHDSLPIRIEQLAAYVTIVPDTVSARVGDVAVFRGTPIDQGYTPTPDTIHWVENFPGTLTFTDTTSVFNQVSVRLDSAFFGEAGFFAQINGQFLGFARILNPVQKVLPGLGNETNGIAVNDSTRLVYVAVDTGVVVVDTTDRVVAFIPVPEPTYYVGVDRTRNLIYAGARFSGTLYVISGQENRVLRSFGVGRFFVPQFAVDEATGNILAPTVICIGTPACVDIDFLGVFDPVTMEVVDTFAIGDQGIATAFDPSTRIVYAGVFVGPLDSVKVIDLGLRKVVASIEVGSSLANLTINPVTKRLYASDYVDNAVYVIDMTTNQLSDRVSVGPAPEGMGVDTVANRIYVTSTSDRFVYVLDGETNGAIQFIDTGGFTSQAAVLQGARQAYVNTYAGKDLRVLKF